MGATTRPHTRNLFAMIDAMDVATLASLFAEDEVAIPCATIFHTDAAGKFDDYRVYVDVARIYA